MGESLTITSIFILGCLHALEPGHGKTFLLAYTVGEKLDLKKISFLTLSLLVSHFLVLSAIAIIFNFILIEVANIYLHELSHWLAPIIILSFGSFIFIRSIYKMQHIHSENCGHQHETFNHTKVDNPITVGLLTGMLPCASSLAVVVMTGNKPTMISIIQFVIIYVLGIASVLFLIVLSFNFAKNIFLEKTKNLKFSINQELLSGCLIILVGFLYLGYTFNQHPH